MGEKNNRKNKTKQQKHTHALEKEKREDSRERLQMYFLSFLHLVKKIHN